MHTIYFYIDTHLAFFKGNQEGMSIDERTTNIIETISYLQFSLADEFVLIGKLHNNQETHNKDSHNNNPPRMHQKQSLMDEYIIHD